MKNSASAFFADAEKFFSIGVLGDFP